MKHIFEIDYGRTFKQFFILVCVISLIIAGLVTYFAYKVNATSVQITPVEVWIYKPMPYSYRLQIMCENGFIGYEYREENSKKCKHLWKKWTKEILSSYK